MRKLLLLLGLIAIYPLEVSARDLVKVVQSNDNRATYYVWRDSIDKRGNIVYWTDEFGNLNPVYLLPGCSAHVKVLFRRKHFYV